MKTRISKLNIDFDFEAYWEIIYLILLAFFVGMRFLLSTMFTIYWPKYFYRTLTVIGVVLVLLHLMMAKDISKKEIAAMLVVTIVFMMSHYVSGYDFLVDLLILILGAYRVNFRNILKTYIAVWSVLLVVTIMGAMLGFAKNLIYFQVEYCNFIVKANFIADFPFGKIRIFTKQNPKAIMFQLLCGANPPFLRKKAAWQKPRRRGFL